MARHRRSKLKKALVGHAGEYYVLFRLAERGILASLAPRGSPLVDILVLSQSESVVATIQVKTRSAGTEVGWLVKERLKRYNHGTFFYVFVDLQPKAPVAYVVPSRVIADHLSKPTESFVAMPGLLDPDSPEERRIQLTHAKSDLINLPLAVIEEFHEHWELLEPASLFSTGGKAPCGQRLNSP